MNLDDCIGYEVSVMNKDCSFSHYTMLDVIEGKTGDRYALVQDDDGNIKIVEASSIKMCRTKWSNGWIDVEG